MKSIISFLVLFFIPLIAKDSIRLISSDLNSSVIEFIPVYDSIAVIINNEKFLRITFQDGYLSDPSNYGAPAIEFRNVVLGVPSEFGNTIQVITADYKDIHGKISPVPRISMKDNLGSYVYELNEKYNTTTSNELITFGEYGISRGLPIQNIIIAPVQFDQQRYTIRLFTKIVFRITYPSTNKTNIKSIEDGLLKDAVINYSAAKSWVKRDERLSKTIKNSVLAEGNWYTFEAPEEGIYKIDRQMLSQMGIDPAAVNPATIKIYNNGGKELPEDVFKGRPEDLQENAIFVSGEEDGKFDAEDYILFYGRGIHFWESDTQNIIKRYYHTYSTKNLYWITSGGPAGKRMQKKQSVTEQASFIQTTTKAYAGWEEDKSKLQPSGRLYLGDMFGVNSSKAYSTLLAGLLPGSEIKYKINFASRSERPATIIVKEQNKEIIRGIISGVGIGKLEDPYYNRGYSYSGSGSFNGTISDNISNLSFSYQPVGEPSTGYLNFFEIYYNKYLQAVNGSLLFYSENSGIVQYELSGFQNIRIFDVTNSVNVEVIAGEIISSGSYVFKAVESDLLNSKYFAVESASYKVPANIKSASNSNLHGITEGAEFIIITPKAFKDQAERLKRHKENDIKVKISTIIIDIDEVFNEFSCGITDVCALRDFLKYAMDNWQKKPEYVLLFGDGDYDYKNLEGKNLNYIIPYESVESYSYLDSYTADDFYASLYGNDFFPDIAIGRLNILSVDDAGIVVDKIIKYETDRKFGLWKNLVTLVADDGQAGIGKPDEYFLHTNQSETLAKQYVWPYFDQKKIYLAFYPTVQTAIGRRKPAVNEAIINAINEGTLILSFVGHGNPDVWTHEYVFEKSTTIPRLTNDKLFFLTAATCDFCRYDLPGRENQSSAELLMLKPDGGAIGIFTAARTVYSDKNAEINQGFYKNLFNYDTLNLLRPVGKSYFITKLAKYNPINDLKFHLFCDPTLRLAAPEIPVQISSINDQDLSTQVQIKALSSIKIEGYVKRVDGSEDTDFNGEALISVYDSERNVVIKEMDNFQVPLQGGVIYRGRVSVTNGRFHADFTVPKDISYENKNGKISAYIFNDNADGIGYTKNIIIGGTDSTVNDDKGPEIIIGFNEDMSGAGYLITPESDLTIKLQDETGLNTTGTGIGHKLEGILNGDERAPIDFTNYFVGDLNAGGKTGSIKYKFNSIEPGDYTIQVKAWDVFNNFSSAERSFTVVSGDDIAIRDVYNYPNPFASNTTFTFQHNLSEPIDVKINVYTVTGRKIKRLEQPGTNDKFVRIDWDGKDEDGNIISNGIYLYKIIVNTIDGRFNKEVLGKLAIIK